MKIKKIIKDVFIQKKAPWWLKYDFLILMLIFLTSVIFKYLQGAFPKIGAQIFLLWGAQNMFKLSYWSLIQKKQNALRSVVPFVYARDGKFSTLVLLILGLILCFFALIII
ncbi:MAG: hypothetical protein WC356_06710 [Candidatus Micrarchaeia archaeon]|jgi:hypothetical protein